MRKVLSVIVPCFNEEDVILAFQSRVVATADKLPAYEFEILYVNDGSLDRTAEILDELASQDERVKVVHLAKNQGHQTAITAGMDFCRGDVIVIIDADLQDPPELIVEIAQKVEEGYDVVHMQRKKRAGETRFKLATARGYYALMKRWTDGGLVENSGDFRGFTRAVLAVVQSFRERHRFMRGIFSAVGFRQCIVRYDRDARYAGETKYPIAKMMRFAINGILGFSTSPIKLIIFCAVAAWLTSFGYLVDALYQHFILKTTVPGWTSIIILLTGFFGVVIFCLGIIASYVGRIFEEGKARPLYWVSEVRNVNVSAIDTRIDELRLAEMVLKRTHDEQ